MSTKQQSFFWGVSLFTLTLVLGLASPALAKAKPPSESSCKPIKHLGRKESSRLHDAVTTAAELKKAFAEPAFQKVVQRVFDEDHLGSLTPELIAAVAALPDDAQPVDVPVGARFAWMAYDHAQPKLMRKACWAGDAPFQAWVFPLHGPDGATLDFIVPSPCANLTLVPSPACSLKTTQDGDTITLDLTGSTAGGVPLSSYGATATRAGGTPEELPPSTSGTLNYTLSCEPGAPCSVHLAAWVEDALGFRADGPQCVKDVELPGRPPACKLAVTFSNNTFHVDAQGSGPKARRIGVNGSGPDGAPVHGEMTGDQRTLDIPYTPVTSGKWTFTLDVEGVNGLHGSGPDCQAETLVCAEPHAKVEASVPECRHRISINPLDSSKVRTVTITGPNGTETLSGDGPWTYDAPRAGSYTVSLEASDGICPEKATATTTKDVKPYGDSADWTLRLYGAYVRADKDTAHEVLSAGTRFEERQKFDLGGHHGGFGIGAEYRPVHDCAPSRLGFAFDVLDSQLEANAMIDNAQGWGMDKDQISFRPLLFSLNYHLTPPGGKADFYVGPTAGYALLGNATFHLLPGRTADERFKDDFIYGLNLGVDVPLGVEHTVAFTAGLRQLFLKAKAEGPTFYSLDLHPTIMTAGFAFKIH